MEAKWSLFLKRSLVLALAMSGLVSCGGSSEVTSGAQYSCGAVASGESRIILSGRTGIGGRYKLSRERDHYEVVLNLRFVDRRSEWGTKASEKMRERVSFCYRQISPYLNGPNGETMTLRLADERDDQLLPPEIEIGVNSYMLRMTATEWDTEHDCSALVHESLHLLGLVDEYRDSLSRNPRIQDHSESFKQTLHDCRPRGPLDSIMNFHDVAFRAISKRYFFAACECRSPEAASPTGSIADVESRTDADSPSEPPADAESLAECRKSLRELRGDPGSCPAGSQLIVQPEIDGVKFELSHLARSNVFALAESEEFKRRFEEYARGILTSDDRYEFSRVLPPLRQSLLLPAQFRVIIEPDCEKANSIYYRCSKNAYRTSRERHGEGCESDTPLECSENSYTWLLQ